MKKKFFFSMALVAVSLSFSKAQIVPDYIVTNQNDTLYGKIKHSDKTMHSIKFKANKEHTYKVIAAGDIKAFMEDGWQYYESQSPGKNQKIFLKCLVSGEVSLFRVKNYFYLLKADSLVKIQKKDTVIGTTKRVDTRYLGLLKILLPNCESVSSRLKQGFYGPRDLSDVVSGYNACVKPQSKSTTYFRTVMQSTQIGIRFSDAASTLKYFVPESQFYKYNFPTTSFFGGAIFFKIRLKSKFSFQPEISFAQKGSAGDELLRNINVARSYDVRLTMLQVPIMFNYSFPLRKIDFVVSLGPLFGHAIAKKATISSYYVKPDQTKVFTSTRSLDIASPEMGYRTGVNLIIPAYKKTKISIGYYYERTLMNYSFTDDKIRTTLSALSVGFIF